MSYVHLIVRDRDRQIDGQCHGGFADAVVAALSAEPETIEELDAALDRFMARGEGSFFKPFRSGPVEAHPDVSPFDAGLVFIDLAARLVLSESTYSAPLREGYVSYHDGRSATEIDVGFHLSSEWEIARFTDDGLHRAASRRRERAASPKQDARAVLYGQPLLEFIVRECLERFRDRPGPLSPEECDVTEIDKRLERDGEVIRGIHARWMLTSRADLDDRCPREVMLAQRDYVGRSLQDREEQWSQTGQCPAGLDPASAAYRFAGFGTTELVVYYDLVRDLLWSCRDAVVAWHADARAGKKEGEQEFVSREMPRLEARREAWLDNPDPEYSGRTPRQLVHNERARIPEGGSGEEMMIDCDCPLCQMEAASGHVGFWHFDGSHMDDDFAFSIYHDTYEEWEQEQRENEELARKWEQEEQRRSVAGDSGARRTPNLGVWEHSYSAPPSPDDPPFVSLFAIGSHLGELLGDLKGETESRELINRLNRDFGNLLALAQEEDAASAEALLEPVLARFVEALDAVASSRNDLEPKCADLRRHVQGLLETPVGSGDSSPPDQAGEDDEDIPY